MNNVIEAINELIKGVNNAYTRGAYSMAEAHDLHEAIEFIKVAASTPQQETQVQETPKKDKKEKDDY
jgi:hypothetical protein